MTRIIFSKIKINKVYLFFLIGLFYSCNDNISIPQETKYFVDIIREKEWTATEVLEKGLGEFEYTKDSLGDISSHIEILNRIKIKYRVVSISYKTLDPYGKSIIASGIIFYPVNLVSKGVVEISPFSRDKMSCGSELMVTTELMPCLIGYTAIIPDLIGYGMTKDMPITYLMHDNIALVSADMRKAAEEYFLIRHGRKLPSESILSGYSLGASSSLALAKFYQHHPEYGIKVKNLFIGGGVFEPRLAVNKYVEMINMPYASIPLVITSMDKYYDLKLNYSNIFIGALYREYKQKCSGYYSPYYLSQYFGQDMRQYMHPDFFTEEKNADFRKIDSVMAIQSLVYGWKPEFPINLYHAVNDVFVPSICSDVLYKEFSSKGTRIVYNLDVNGSHFSVAIKYYTDLAKYLNNKKL